MTVKRYICILCILQGSINTETLVIINLRAPKAERNFQLLGVHSLTNDLKTVQHLLSNVQTI